VFLTYYLGTEIIYLFLCRMEIGLDESISC